MHLGIIFNSSPYQGFKAREGLDTLLVCSNLFVEISVFFLNQGVLNLHPQPKLEQLVPKDYLANFKLLDLYEIKQRFLCVESLQRFNLNKNQLLIDIDIIARSEITQQLKIIDKIITF